MKLMSMVLAAALVPAAAFAGPGSDQDQQNQTQNTPDQTQPQNQGPDQNQPIPQNQPSQTSPDQGQNTGATGMNQQGSTQQQTVEVEAFEWSTGQGRLGLMLMGLTPQLRTYFGAPNTGGLLVAQVAPGSPASRAGVKVGDVITKVDNQSVQSADDIVSATRSSTDTSVQIHVIRNKKGMNLQARLGTQQKQGQGQNQNQNQNQDMNPNQGT